MRKPLLLYEYYNVKTKESVKEKEFYIGLLQENLIVMNQCSKG